MTEARVVIRQWLEECNIIGLPSVSSKIRIIRSSVNRLYVIGSSSNEKSSQTNWTNHEGTSQDHFTGIPGAVQIDMPFAKNVSFEVNNLTLAE